MTKGSESRKMGKWKVRLVSQTRHRVMWKVVPPASRGGNFLRGLGWGKLRKSSVRRMCGNARISCLRKNVAKNERRHGLLLYLVDWEGDIKGEFVEENLSTGKRGNFANISLLSSVTTIEPILMYCYKYSSVENYKRQFGQWDGHLGSDFWPRFWEIFSYSPIRISSWTYCDVPFAHGVHETSRNTGCDPRMSLVSENDRSWNSIGQIDAIVGSIFLLALYSLFLSLPRFPLSIPAISWFRTPSKSHRTFDDDTLLREDDRRSKTPEKSGW
jgi:hypothetical protein